MYNLVIVHIILVTFVYGYAIHRLYQIEIPCSGLNMSCNLIPSPVPNINDSLRVNMTCPHVPNWVLGIAEVDYPLLVADLPVVHIGK